MTENVLRQHAEQQYAQELAELAKADERTRPPNWKLSPWAAATYVMGGTLESGFVVSPKYIGDRRLIEIAIATLTTDRALLLLGVPGTAKSCLQRAPVRRHQRRLDPAGAGDGGHGPELRPLRLELRQAAGGGPLAGGAGAQPGDGGDGGGQDRPL